jgi:hypothetical protein
MSTATETTTAAVNSAAKKAAVAASAVAEALPTVVATEEITATLEVPTKVVLNQGLVVATAFVGGIAVTAGAVFGWKKYQAYKNKKAVEAIVDEATTSTEVK